MKTKFLGGTGFCTSHSLVPSASGIPKWDVRKHVPPFFRVDDSDLEEMKKATEKRKADGIAAPGENRPTYIPDLNTPRKMEFIADSLLKRGHKSGVIEKILGANFKRVFGEIWTA